MEADNLRDIEDPGFVRVATWRGLVALAIVATVALGSGLMLSLETQRQAALATDVNQAGRLRMLTQRIAVAAATGQHGRLVDSAVWLEEVLDHLHTSAVEPLGEVADPDLVEALESYLAQADAAVLGDARAAAELPAAAESLLPGVDRTVTAYETLAAERLARIQAGAFLGVGATLFAAGIAWLGVARPGLRELREASANTTYAASLARDWAQLLQRQLEFQQGLTELAMRVVAADDLDAFLNSSCELVRVKVGADWCALMQIGPARQARLRASVGTIDDIPDDIGELPQASYTLLSRNALLVEDLDREPRFPAPGWLTERGMRSSISAIVPGRREPFGVLCAHSREPGGFTREELEFLTTAASIIGSLFERSMAELTAADRESRFLRFAERANDLIFRYQVSPVRRCLYVNDAAISVLGHPPQAWLDDPALLDRLHEAGDPAPSIPVLTTDPDEQRQLITIAHPDGGTRRLELQTTVLPLPDDGGIVVEGIARDVTERERAHEVLEQALTHEQQAAAELRDIDRMKDAFLEAVSHELRTPLTVILGLVETLDRHDGVLAAEQRGELVARLGSNAHRLDRLLADLLDLNRLTRGLTEAHVGPVDVDGLVGRCLADVDTGGRPIVTSLEPARAVVDAVLLERVVVNLVENAVKHTPPGTPIHVEVRSGPDIVEVVVADEGPGVPPELRGPIFEPFRRGPDAPAHAPGHGIGLTLVQRFVELQGGRTWVGDREGGPGAAFHVELPAASD